MKTSRTNRVKRAALSSTISNDAYLPVVLETDEQSLETSVYEHFELLLNYVSSDDESNSSYKNTGFRAAGPPPPPLPPPPPQVDGMGSGKGGPLKRDYNGSGEHYHNMQDRRNAAQRLEMDGDVSSAMKREEDAMHPYYDDHSAVGGSLSPHFGGHHGAVKYEVDETSAQGRDSASGGERHNTQFQCFSTNAKGLPPRWTELHALRHRDGWAAERLSKRTQYQVFPAPGVFSTFHYVLTAADYEWCEEQNLSSPAELAIVVTVLERSYAKHIVDALQSFVDSKKEAEAASAAEMNNTQNGTVAQQRAERASDRNEAASKSSHTASPAQEEPNSGGRRRSSAATNAGGSASEGERRTSAQDSAATGNRNVAIAGSNAPFISTSGLPSRSAALMRAVKSGSAPTASSRDGVITIALPPGTQPPAGMMTSTESSTIIVKRGRGRPPTNPASIAAAAARTAEAACSAQLTASQFGGSRDSERGSGGRNRKGGNNAANNAPQPIIVRSNLPFASGNKARLEFVTAGGQVISAMAAPPATGGTRRSSKNGDKERPSAKKDDSSSSSKNSAASNPKGSSSTRGGGNAVSGSSTTETSSSAADHKASSRESGSTAGGASGTKSSNAHTTVAPSPQDQNMSTPTEEEDNPMFMFCGICGESLPLNDPSVQRCVECSQRAHDVCWRLRAPATPVGSPTNSVRGPLGKTKPGVSSPNALGVDTMWLCDVCETNQRKTKMAICAACNRSGGIMLQTEGENGIRPPQPFCHVICAMVFPELRIDSDRRLVIFSARIDRRRYQMQCLYCGRCDGACAQCRHPNCFESMHPQCALQARTIEIKRQLGFLSGSNDASQHMDGSGANESAGLNIPCLVYCRDHFTGVVEVPDALGASNFFLLNEQAELAAQQAITAAHAAAKKMVDGGSVASDSMRIAAIDLDKGMEEAFALTLKSMNPRHIKVVCDHWLDLRAMLHRSTLHAVQLMEMGSLPIVQSMYFPALMKVTPTKVQVARFLSLIPEIQRYLVSTVEGVLPLKDEEEEMENNVKNHTRSSGNSVKLFRRMEEIALSLSELTTLASCIEERVSVENELAAVELKLLGNDLDGEQGDNH